MPAVPVVLVGREFWRGAFSADFLAGEGTIDPEDREIFGYADTGAEAWDIVCRWHADAGTPDLELKGSSK